VTAWRVSEEGHNDNGGQAGSHGGYEPNRDLVWAVSVGRKSENGWVGEERKEEGDDRSGPHIGQVVVGALQAIRKYVGLRVGPRISNTYKMARLKEHMNCNGMITNT